jgi:exodeoxyribonuclease VII small subunit
MTKRRSPKNADEQISFEQAVEQLEEIIDQVESGEIGLEECLERYEKGTVLIKRCQAVLDQAQKRIAELKPAAAGDGIDIEEADAQ